MKNKNDRVTIKSQNIMTHWHNTITNPHDEMTN